MKNKNAFTLIEIISVIAILSVITLLVFPKFGGNINSKKEKELENTKILIQNAAKTYHMFNELEFNISVKDLVEKKFLVSYLYNPVNEELLDGCVRVLKDKDDYKVYKYVSCDNVSVPFIIELDGGNSNKKYNTSYNASSKVDLEIPHKDGYEFNGWELVKGNGFLKGNTYVVGDTETIIHAKWTRIVNLNIELDGGISNQKFEKNYKVGSIIHLISPTKTGYTFKGWDIDNGDSIVSGNILTIGNNDTNIKALWEANTYKITFNSNGGTIDTVSKNVVYDDIYGIMPTPIKENHMFLGWYNDENNEIGSDNKVDILNDIALTAHYIKNEFDYTGKYETFVVPKDGYYKLEVWGAQGGSLNEIYYGGYGGYSTGYIYLNKGETLFINVGGKGLFKSGHTKGGYNGGGDSTRDTQKYTGAGGGATHISKENGLLSSLSAYANNNNSPILIVAGGGGGASQSSDGSSFGIGGSGGGFKGKNGTSEYDETYIGYGGTQKEGGASEVENGSFGKGGNASTASSTRGGGGGGGYYGGGSGYKNGAAGGGGSGYIANTKLFDKYMICFECSTSSNNSTKTYSVNSASETKLSNYPKKGDGAAKITFVGNYEKIEYDYTGFETTYTVKTSGTYKLEVWGAQGGSYNENYHGGYGGYSMGYINLNNGDKLFINVGGQGLFEPGYTKGGYNGGGDSTYETEEYTGSGGGATHIATKSGLLSSLSTYAGNNDSPILIVAGGGGGTSQDINGKYFGIGGSGGGFKGNGGTSEYNETYIGYGGTQSDGGSSKVENGSFGKGGNASTASSTRGGGGGGGYYGGGSGYKNGAAGGGGSGYIANTNLFDKRMVCFECNTSNSSETKTISSITSSSKPISEIPKQGNGYIKITYIDTN